MTMLFPSRRSTCLLRPRGLTGDARGRSLPAEHGQAALISTSPPRHDPNLDPNLGRAARLGGARVRDQPCRDHSAGGDPGAGPQLRPLRRWPLSALWAIQLIGICALAPLWTAAANAAAADPPSRHLLLPGWRSPVGSIESAYGVPTPPPPVAMAVWRQFLVLHAGFRQLEHRVDPAGFARWAVLNGVTGPYDLQLMLTLYLWFERHRHA
jgi:hypothetical protein